MTRASDWIVSQSFILFFVCFFFRFVWSAPPHAPTLYIIKKSCILKFWIRNISQYTHACTHAQPTPAANMQLASDRERVRMYARTHTPPHKNMQNSTIHQQHTRTNAHVRMYVWPNGRTRRLLNCRVIWSIIPNRFLVKRIFSTQLKRLALVRKSQFLEDTLCYKLHAWLLTQLCFIILLPWVIVWW